MGAYYIINSDDSVVRAYYEHYTPKVIPQIKIDEAATTENLDKIFLPYFTSKARPENLGLGLSIVFRTISENNGTIEILSKMGEGTKVRVLLPST